MSKEIRQTIVDVKVKGGGSWKRYFVKFSCGHVYRFPGVCSASLFKPGNKLRCRDCEFVRDAALDKVLKAGG